MKAILIGLVLLPMAPTVFTSAQEAAPSQSRELATLSGRVLDIAANPLASATVEIDPHALRLFTDREGRFTAASLDAGEYQVRISYVGFKDETQTVKVGRAAHVAIEAKLAPQVSESVTVTASRARGEVSALNQQKNADNIVNVLPADVITSLPNMNVADAIGRLPSVSLERDEGEGKFVQVRGLEPRYTNGAINGAHIPSALSSGRELKLDAIPSDLVGAIELHKTISADQDGDAIGGSINLVTKVAGNQEAWTLGAQGGYTDLQGGRYVYQYNGTYANRLGPDKKLGVVLGGTYDWNGRGIDDIEPGLDVVSLPGGASSSAFNAIDARFYQYERSRFGAAGGVDYRFDEHSSMYLRGLFSEFHNYGDRWVSSSSAGDFLTPTLTDDGGGLSGSVQNRRPNEQTYSVSAGGAHGLGAAHLDYNLSYSHARQNVADARQADFEGPSAAFRVDGSDGFFPQLTPLGVDPSDASQYEVTGYRITDEKTANRDLAFAANVIFPYKTGGHDGEFKVGGKYRDEHKTNDINDQRFTANGKSTFLVSQGLQPLDASNFYFGRYTLGPALSLDAATQFFNSTPGAFVEDLGRETLGNKPNDYDVTEKIAAFYAKNTMRLGQLRLEAGVRVEHTSANYDGFEVNRDSLVISPSNGSASYTDVLPSVSLIYEVNPSTNLRGVYGWAIARPDYADVVPKFQISDIRKQVAAGNPDLEPTQGRSYDVLVEHYLGAGGGVIAAGGFYKSLAHPIYAGSVTTLTSGPFAGYRQTQPINGPEAKIYGAEATWQQHLGFLPGFLDGLGITANYTYTNSEASFDPTTGRTGTARLQRTTPHAFNLNLTYDKGRFALRAAVTYNSATIWAYQYTDGADGGLTGPLGDTYLYPHTQVDAQASYGLPKGLQLIVSGLNLNNQVFGFYNGDQHWNIQREFYGPTVFVGFKVNH